VMWLVILGLLLPFPGAFLGAMVGVFLKCRDRYGAPNRGPTTEEEEKL
jgi:hypothetical protein